MTMIHDLWIMRENGIVLYQKCSGDVINGDLFGGFMSAINSVAALMSNSDIQSMIMGNKKLSMIKRHGILFIAFHDKRDRESKVDKKLVELSRLFFKQYTPDMLENWQGNTEIFTTLNKEIDNIFMTYDEIAKQIFNAL
ncbi:MAG TPA: hypothetical protein VKM55_25510 [Candidatus Lokiarchaeia archaeon]|nr:hypothetical protein [Candidatus Lokiarchaeia archaeon]